MKKDDPKYIKFYHATRPHIPYPNYFLGVKINNSFM